MGYPHSWVTAQNPQWSCGCEYRIKPKEPRIVEKYALVGVCISEKTGIAHWIHGAYSGKIKDKYRHHPEYNDKYEVIANIKLLCNEETGEILSVELIKENK